MSDEKDPELDALVAEAFARRGELVPTTEAEVERAEQDGVEFDGELPESLRELAPPAPPPSEAGKIVSLEDARRARFPWLTHAIAAAVGAAAAAAILLGRGTGEAPIGGVPSGEPPAPRPDATSEAKLEIAPVLVCPAACCAGKACAAAKADLRECSSGRSCVGCTFAELADERFRIKLSSFAPSDPARKLLEAGKTELDLCVQLGSSRKVCVPAHASSDGSESWSTLPLVGSAQDLLAGFLLEVRARGSGQLLAEWRSPVRINPTLLCKGLFIKAKTGKDETFGVVSAFLEDTHYVEIARSDSLVRLEEHAERLRFSDVTPRIFETTGAGRERFALSVGPLAKASAERLRRALLAHGEKAEIRIGQDHVGAPLAPRQ